MRVILVGTVDSTRVTLRALLAVGIKPVLVVGLDAALSHRHSDYVDMGEEAAAAGLPFMAVRSINHADTVQEIASLSPDWLIVVGWSQICREPLLAIPTRGSIGYHPSALPDLRGRAVLAWTILLDRPTTAGTLFRLAPGVDSGEILAQQTFKLDPRETLGSLLKKHLGALHEMWLSLAPRLAEPDLQGRVQDDAGASYCGIRRPDDGAIDWNADAVEIDRLVRAVSRPYPGAFSNLRGERLTVWRSELWTGPNYFAPQGQIVSVDGDDLLVACRDHSCILIREWEWNGDHAQPPRVGDRFSAGQMNVLA